MGVVDELRAAYTQLLAADTGQSKAEKKYAFTLMVQLEHPELFDESWLTSPTSNSVVVNTEIHPSVRIGANCSIGLPGFGYAKGPDGSWLRFPHVGRVIIERDVEIGSNVCIDRGSLGDTIIMRGVKIDNHCHIAHNVTIGEDSLIIAHAMIGGSVTIGKGVWVGPSVAVMNQVTIGDGAVIGLGAVVLGRVEAGATVVGNPARPLERP